MKANVLPIYFRELKAIFYSPVAYIVLFAFYVLSSFFWWAILQWATLMSSGGMMRQGGGVKISDMFNGFLGNVGVTAIFLLPLVSMRMFSEEKKAGTIETLFTYPFSDLDIVLGKFMAGITLLLAMLLPLLLFPLGLKGLPVHWPGLLTGFLGVFLMGMSYLAVGIFFSAMTENQVVAGALGFGFSLLLFVVGWLEQATSGVLRDLVVQVWAMTHLQEFTKGILSLRDASYFILLAGMSLFATLRLLESKKWR